MNTTTNPTKSTILKPIQKSRRNSPLRRPGAILASLRQKSFPASLHGSAWPSLPAGSDGPAPKLENTEPGGKMPKNPPASDQKTTAGDSLYGYAADGSYWTIDFPPLTEAEREQAGFTHPAVRRGPPHSEACAIASPTVKSLMALCRQRTLDPEALNRPGIKFVRVQPTENGLNMVWFPSYAAAEQADITLELIGEFAALQSEADSLGIELFPVNKSTTNKARMGSEVKL